MKQYTYVGEQSNEYSTTVTITDGEDTKEIRVSTNYPDSGQVHIQVDGVTIVPHAPHTREGRRAQSAVDWFANLPEGIRNHINALWEYWSQVDRIYAETGESGTQAACDAMTALPYPSFSA